MSATLSGDNSAVSTVFSASTRCYSCDITILPFIAPILAPPPGPSTLESPKIRMLSLLKVFRSGQGLGP
jgi:hypothetical protein